MGQSLCGAKSAVDVKEKPSYYDKIRNNALENNQINSSEGIQKVDVERPNAPKALSEEEEKWLLSLTKIQRLVRRAKFRREKENEQHWKVN